MSIINSTHIRRSLGLHVSSNEMKGITQKYPNGDIKNADKHLKRDIKRISNTINETDNLIKCHMMANFLKSIKDTNYYTPSVKKSLLEYTIKHGRDVIRQSCNKSKGNNESEYANVGGVATASKGDYENEYDNLSGVATASKGDNENEYDNLSSVATASKSDNENEYDNLSSVATASKSDNENEYANTYSAKAICALEKYTGTGYLELNNALRNSLPLDGTMQEVIKGLNEIFAKNPDFGSLLKTFRGVSHKTNLSALKEGEIEVIKGYLSTSRDVNVANNFRGMDGEELNIFFGKSHCDLSKKSKYPFEQEELYPHGIKVRKLFQHDLGKMRINIFEEVTKESTSVRKTGAALDLATEKETPKTHNIAKRRTVQW
ncbi:ADP-ribosyltransferase [Salmonella enterica]